MLNIMTNEQHIKWEAELERRNTIMSEETQELAIGNLRKLDIIEQLHKEIAELKVVHSVQYGQQLDMFDNLKKDYLSLLHYTEELEA